MTTQVKESERVSRTKIIGFDMPFWEMVVFFMKIVFAMIPAAFFATIFVILAIVVFNVVSDVLFGSPYAY